MSNKEISEPHFTVQELLDKIKDWQKQREASFVPGDLNDQAYLTWLVKDLHQDLSWLYHAVIDVLENAKALQSDLQRLEARLEEVERIFGTQIVPPMYLDAPNGQNDIFGNPKKDKEE